MKANTIDKGKIDLGGGLAPRPGYISIDLIKEADIRWDLNNGLPMVGKEMIPNERFMPILPNTVEVFAASHILEHLNNIIPLMNDCYETLKKGGIFEISTPYAGTTEFWQDPTHKRGFVENSFLYFAKDSPFKKEQKEYGITARFEIVRNERGEGVDNWQLFVVLVK